MNKSFITNLAAIILIIIGCFSPLYGEEIKTMGLYSFSGAITNWLAIHMLFEKVPFLYGSGIVTERFEEFKDGIKDLIMKQFFTAENFEKFLGEAKGSMVKVETESLMESIDFDMVFNKIKEAIMESSFGGMLGMMGGEEALEPLRAQFHGKFKEIIYEIMSSDHFLSSMDKGNEGSATSMIDKVTDVVEARLGELSPKMVKEIIQDMIQKHLGWLVVWGGVFGAIIGLASTFAK